MIKLERMWSAQDEGDSDDAADDRYAPFAIRAQTMRFMGAPSGTDCFAVGDCVEVMGAPMLVDQFSWDQTASVAYYLRVSHTNADERTATLVPIRDPSWISTIRLHRLDGHAIAEVNVSAPLVLPDSPLRAASLVCMTRWWRDEREWSVVHLKARSWRADSPPPPPPTPLPPLDTLGLHELLSSFPTHQQPPPSPLLPLDILGLRPLLSSPLPHQQPPPASAAGSEAGSELHATRTHAPPAPALASPTIEELQRQITSLQLEHDALKAEVAWLRGERASSRERNSENNADSDFARLAAAADDARTAPDMQLECSLERPLSRDERRSDDTSGWRSLPSMSPASVARSRASLSAKNQLQEWCRDPARRYAVPDYSDCSPDVHGGGWRCKVQITNAAGKVVLTEVGTAGSKKTASLNAAEMALRRIWRLDAGHRS